MARLVAYLVGPHAIGLPSCFYLPPTYNPSRNPLTLILGGLHPLLKGRGNVAVSLGVEDLKRMNMVSIQREHTSGGGEAMMVRKEGKGVRKRRAHE